MELPRGEIGATAFVEAARVFVLVMEGRLFLRDGTESREVVLEDGYSALELSAAHGTTELAVLVLGPPRPRRTESLIVDRHYIRVVDAKSGACRSLETAGAFSVMKLLGAAARPNEVLCVCSDSRRSTTHVLVAYHVAALSLVTGEISMLAADIGARW